MQRPQLIVFSGLPGSGKSTIADAVAEKARLPLLSVDPIESAIVRSGIARSFETGLAAYVVAETLAAEQLKRGLSVVIDAVNAVREAREMWRQLVVRQAARLVVVECVLDRDLHRQRIEARVRGLPGLPEVTWESVEDRRREYLPWDEERLVLDSAADVEANVRRVLRYMRSA